MELGRKSPARVGAGLPKGLVDAAKKQLLSRDSGVKIETFDDPRLLVIALKAGKIDAAVRGTMGSGKMIEELKREFGLKEIMRTAVLEDVKGKQFLLTPVGIDEGMDMES